MEKMSEPVNITDLNFDKIISQYHLVLIDFWSPLCRPCLTLNPMIEELAKEYSGKIFIGKLNVHENPITTERFEIFVIPTLIIMKDGKEVDRIIGFISKEQIEDILKEWIKNE